MFSYSPILNWVRDDNRDVVLTGAVLAGKHVRLQAVWEYWGSYMGPERFTIRTGRSRFRYGRKVNELTADSDGPPRTHSRSAWQTGIIRQFRHQQRYYFTDTQAHRSGPLIVSNLAAYTTEPRFEVEADARVPLPVRGGPGVIARAGRATTKFMIGATADPAVRVSIMTTSDDSGVELLRNLAPRSRQISPTDPLFFLYGSRPPWHPVFENGGRELLLDVDDEHPAEITVVPQSPYEERQVPFMTAFALRVEDVNDPEQYVISDVVTVEGGVPPDFQRVRAASRRGFSTTIYLPGTVLFRI